MPHTTQALGLQNVTPTRGMIVSTFDLINLLHLVMDRIQVCKSSIMSGVGKQEEYFLREDIKYWEVMRDRIEKTIADPHNYAQ
jgi:hypothetical protein